MTVMLKVSTISTGWQGAPGYTQMYFRPGTGGGSNADAADVVARVRAFWAALPSIFATSQQFAVQQTAEAIEDTSGTLTGAFPGGTPAVVTGSGSASLNAIASMVVLRQRTNLIVNGRFLQGRTYIGPVQPAVENALGGVGTTYQTLIASAATSNLLTGATASFPVIWHRPVNHAGGTSGPVTSYNVWSSFGVLRSRRD